MGWAGDDRLRTVETIRRQDGRIWPESTKGLYSHRVQMEERRPCPGRRWTVLDVSQVEAPGTEPVALPTNMLDAAMEPRAVSRGERRWFWRSVPHEANRARQNQRLVSCCAGKRQPLPHMTRT